MWPPTASRLLRQGQMSGPSENLVHAHCSRVNGRDRDYLSWEAAPFVETTEGGRCGTERERERRAITPPEVLVEDRGKTIGKGEKKQKGEVKETRCWLA